jgi:GNAT superfamily N-acetyltransferase
MSDLEIVAATAARWDDVQELLGTNGDSGCWCQAWRGLDAKALAGGRTRQELLLDQIVSGPPAPGFLAYLDGVPVDWVGVGVRKRLPRLVNSRTIPAIDELLVWAIGCFRIRPGYRRRGVASALLHEVVAAGLPRHLVRLDLEPSVRDRPEGASSQ